MATPEHNQGAAVAGWDGAKYVALAVNADGKLVTETEVTIPPVEVDNGTAITGESLESGGAGPLGWLSSIRKALADRLGALTETAPATDTASSGLNGRLQRVAQRLTSLIALLPSALSNDRLKSELGDGNGAAVTAAAAPASDARGLVVRQAGGVDLNAQSLTSLTVTIANGTSLSDAVDLSGRGLVRILMPAAWDAASLTFQVSQDGSAYYNLYSDSSEYTVSAAGASRSIIVFPGDFIGLRYLKVRSGTSGAAVNQTGNRSIVLLTRPLA